MAALRFPQMFRAARQKGAKTPAEWAGFAWTVLQGPGQALVKDGVTFQGEDNLKEPTRQMWGKAVLPLWPNLRLQACNQRGAL